MDRVILGGHRGYFLQATDPDSSNSMYRGRTMSLSFPPFTRWVKRLIIICAAVYFLKVVFERIAPEIEGALELYLGLVPAAGGHCGFIWRPVTYSFLPFALAPPALHMLARCVC